jgi:hypothetical protein
VGESRALEVVGPTVHDLDELLDSTVGELRLVDVTQLQTLAGLERVPLLRHLTIVNAPLVRSLEPIRALAELRSLRIAIAMSKTSNQRIDSFRPLAELRRLESLRLTGVVAADKSLRPLHQLQQLREVSIPNFYGVEEFGRLAGALPNARGFGLSAVVDDHPGRCSRCGQQTEVQLIGRQRNRFVCVSCDAQGVAAHRARFEHWREAQTATPKGP